MKIGKNTVFFLFGGGIYVGLELSYRRRSHISMFAAGGICFLLLGKLREMRIGTWTKPFLGALVITAVELITGLTVNRRYRVWDYRNMPGNYRGQICPAFTLLWIPLSGAAMGLYGILDRKWEALSLRK